MFDDLYFQMFWQKHKLRRLNSSILQHNLQGKSPGAAAPERSDVALRHSERIVHK